MPEQSRTGVDLLDGIRVVDFTHVHAGPLCAYQLGLMGADIIKVESPSAGDQLRAGHPEGLPPAFLGQNANKRSLAVDLKQPEGQQAVHRLVRTADVVLHNMRPGTPDVRRVHRRAYRKPLIAKAKEELASLRQQPSALGRRAAKAASTVGATRLLRRGAFQFPSGSRLAAICAVAIRGDMTSTRCNGGPWNTVQREPWAHRCAIPLTSTSKRAGEAVCAIVPRRPPYRWNGTGYAANRSLRAVHRWQRRCAKRPDNVPPRNRGPATVRKPVESASYTSGQGARLAGMVNASECADKCRYVDQAEVADTLEPKWYVVRFSLQEWGNAATRTTGKQATPNPALLHRRNSVSPSPRPLRGRGAARRTVAVAGRGWWKKRMPCRNGVDTGLKHARRGNPCPLPPGRSLRDDLPNPPKGARIGLRRSGRPRRRGNQTRPLRGYELKSPASVGGQRERARLGVSASSRWHFHCASLGTSGAYRRGVAAFGLRRWFCQRGFAAA